MANCAPRAMPRRRLENSFTTSATSGPTASAISVSFQLR